MFVVEAYIFVNSEPGMLWQIADEALKIDGVKMAHAVTGQFDVVAYAEIVNMDALGKIISKFQSIQGVQRTQTVVAIPLRVELEKD